MSALVCVQVMLAYNVNKLYKKHADAVSRARIAVTKDMLRTECNSKARKRLEDAVQSLDSLHKQVIAESEAHPVNVLFVKAEFATVIPPPSLFLCRAHK
jgi:hypothetical protein